MISRAGLWVSLAFLVATISGTVLARPPEVGPEEASEKCVNPDPYALMGGEFAGLERADYLFFGGRLRWLFISWGAPPSGEVFVLDCGGHVLARRAFGYAERLDIGADPDGRTSVVAHYIPASGTGLDLHSVAILAFDGKRIKTLWDHDVEDNSTFPAYLMFGPPKGQGWRTDSGVYDWEYGDHGRVILVTGRETRSTGARTIRRVLPPEKYCFKPQEDRYARC